jgi:hypothetical protein
MRSTTLLPLALLLAVGACSQGPEESGRASTVPTRDLTLERSPAPPAEVASPLELAYPRPEQPRVHRPRRERRAAPAPSPHVPPPDAAPVAHPAPVPAIAPATPAVYRSSTRAAAADPRALAPGQTVTVIPASSGPSVGSDPVEAAPSRAGRAILIGRGHGGTCQPRGARRATAPASSRISR